MRAAPAKNINVAYDQKIWVRWGGWENGEREREGEWAGKGGGRGAGKGEREREREYNYQGLFQDFAQGGGKC